MPMTAPSSARLMATLVKGSGDVLMAARVVALVAWAVAASVPPMSAATVPVALVESLEEGRVTPHAKLLLPAFGAGLTLCSHYVEWGTRTTPKDVSSAELPPCEKTALEMVNEIRALKDPRGRSAAGIANAYVVDKTPYVSSVVSVTST